MSTSSLEAWALPRLQSLLPLDTDSLKQIITYTAQLSPDESASHLRNLLGEDLPGVLEFIAGFNSRRPRPSTTTTTTTSVGGQTARQDNGERSSRTTKEAKKQKGDGSLRASDSQRRPDGHGDVSGGYLKSEKKSEGDYYMSPAPRDRAGQVTSSAQSSRNRSPAVEGGATSTVPPSAQGPLISDYLPNVRSKRATKPSSGATRSSRGATASNAKNRSSSPSSTTTTTTTNNIADLTAAIAALEVSTNPKERKQRKCNCNARLHPLFTPAPNCLSCGKIICALEGLQPCSFCGTPLLSATEVQEMIRELRAERGTEKMRAHNESMRPGGGGPAPVDAGRSSGGGGRINTSDWEAAKAHRDRLLAFQAQNAQRTRIVDEAADFDLPSVSSTQWMSPAQRALALKKQQRILREMEERARPEWEKKNVVMSLEITKGKVVRTYETTSSPGGAAAQAEEGEDEDDGLLLDTSGDTHELGSGTAFSNNPLLRGSGLVRPVWKPAVDRPVQERRREQRQTWRRVQDDNEDNEQWILDGGLHGYQEVAEDGKA
ncbi:hypothetical protein VTO42DRAFT_6158 [Malbranchea cinnamomea]